MIAGRPSKSTVLRGIAASPGIGIGKAFVFKEEALSYEFRALARDEVRKEIQRFRQAVGKTRTDILQSRDKVLKVLGKSHASLIDVHLLILEDTLFSKDIEKKITHELMNAEAALVAVLDGIGRTFSSLNDEYFRQRKDDIMDVGKHVMRHLLGRHGARFLNCVTVRHRDARFAALRHAYRCARIFPRALRPTSGAAHRTRRFWRTGLANSRPSWD